jgi:hypothetical protein
MSKRFLNSIGMVALLALLSVGVNRAPADSAEKEAVRAVERFGGRVVPPEGRTVTEVSLVNSTITDSDLGLLRAFVNLEKLDLRLSKVTGVGLQELTGLSKLREVDLSSTLVSGEGLLTLRALRNLTAVRLNYTLVTDESLAELFLSNHSRLVENLKTLSLSGTKITDGSLTVLGKLKQLEELDLSRTKVTLDVSRLPKEQQGPSLLPSRLKTVNLSESAVTNFGIVSFVLSPGRNMLNSLDLSGTNTTLWFWWVFAAPNVSSLTTLQLSRTSTTDYGLWVLRSLSLPPIKSLNLAENFVTDQGLPYLAAFTDLKTLDLARTGVSGEGVAALALTELDLSGTLVSDRVLKSILRDKNSRLRASLETLHFDDTGITDDGLLFFEQFPKSKEYFGRNTKITKAGLMRAQSLRARKPFGPPLTTTTGPAQ